MNKEGKEQNINSSYETAENKFIRIENEHSLKIYKKNILVLIVVFFAFGITVRILGTIVQSINTNFNNETMNDLNIMLDGGVDNAIEVLDEFYYDELYYSSENKYDIDDEIITEYMKTYIDIYDFYDDIYIYLKNNIAYKSGKNEKEKFYIDYSQYFKNDENSEDYLILDLDTSGNNSRKMILKKFYNFEDDVIALIGIEITSKDFTVLFDEIVDIIFPNNIIIFDNQGKILYSTLDTYTQLNKINSILAQNDVETNTTYHEKDYLWMKNEKLGANIVLVPKHYRNIMIFDVTYYGRILMILIDSIIVILFIIAGYSTNKLRSYIWIGFLVSCILSFTLIGGIIIINKYEYEKNIKTALRRAWVLECCLNNYCDENKTDKFIYTYYYMKEYYNDKISDDIIKQSISKKKNILSYDTKFIELSDNDVDVNSQSLEDGKIVGKYGKVYKISDDKRILINVLYTSNELEKIEKTINKINEYSLKKDIRNTISCENFQFSQLNKTYNYNFENSEYTLTDNVLSANKGVINDNIELEIDNAHKKIIVKIYKNQDLYLCQKRISFTYNMFDFSNRIGKALIVIAIVYVYTIIYYYLNLYIGSQKIRFVPDEKIENRYNYLNHRITADTYVEDAKESEYYMINEYPDLVDKKEDEEKVSFKATLNTIKEKLIKYDNMIKNVFLNKKSKNMIYYKDNNTNENIDINLEEYMKYEETEIKKIKDEKVIKFDDDE